MMRDNRTINLYSSSACVRYVKPLISAVRAEREDMRKAGKVREDKMTKCETDLLQKMGCGTGYENKLLH